MNKAILMGRLASDPEIRYTSGAQATAVCRYTLAVDRPHKRDGEQAADFIRIVSFGKRGEFANKYFRKGKRVAVIGEIRVSSYTDKSGNKRWSTEIFAEEQYFADSNKDYGGYQDQKPEQHDEFSEIDDADIPF